MSPGEIGILKVEIQYIKEAIERADLAREKSDLARERQTEIVTNLSNALTVHMREETEGIKELIRTIDEKYANKNEVVTKLEFSEYINSTIRPNSVRWYDRIGSSDFWAEAIGKIILFLSMFIGGNIIASFIYDYITHK